MASKGELEAARRLFDEAAALELPNDSAQRLRFSRAAVEAHHGDAQRARLELMELEPWARLRQDFLDGYLETRAAAEARSGDTAAAYATMVELLDVLRGIQAHERNVRLKRQERQPHQARSAALEALTRQDALTGLSNRRDVQERGAHLLERGQPLLVALIDVDDFKRINDTYGHVVGDAVLIALAVLIRREVGEQDVVARLGGDEFLVLREGDDLPAFRQVMQGLCEASAVEVLKREGLEGRVTLSVGVTRVERTLAAALEQADQAMYQVKHQGKNGAYLLTAMESI